MVGVLDGEAEALEAGGVAAQLEDPEDPHHSEDLDDSLDSVVLLALHLGVQKDQGDEVGEDRQDVDDVETALEEVPLVAGCDEAKDVLEGEPGDAGRLNHGQGLVVRVCDIFGCKVWQCVKA